jgi:hypothetical protein
MNFWMWIERLVTLVFWFVSLSAGEKWEFCGEFLVLTGVVGEYIADFNPLLKDIFSMGRRKQPRSSCGRSEFVCYAPLFRIRRRLEHRGRIGHSCN